MEDFYEIKVHDQTAGASVIGNLKFKMEDVNRIFYPASKYEDRDIVHIFFRNVKDWYRVEREEIEYIMAQHKKQTTGK